MIALHLRCHRCHDSLCSLPCVVSFSVLSVLLLVGCTLSSVCQLPDNFMQVQYLPHTLGECPHGNGAPVGAEGLCCVQMQCAFLTGGALTPISLGGQAKSTTMTRATTQHRRLRLQQQQQHIQQFSTCAKSATAGSKRSTPRKTTTTAATTGHTSQQ